MRGPVAHAPRKETRGWRTHCTSRRPSVKSNSLRVNSWRGCITRSLVRSHRQISDMLILRVVRAACIFVPLYWWDESLFVSWQTPRWKSHASCRPVILHFGVPFVCLLCASRREREYRSLLHVKCSARRAKEPRERDTHEIFIGTIDAGRSDAPNTPQAQRHAMYFIGRLGGKLFVIWISNFVAVSSGIFYMTRDKKTSNAPYTFLWKIHNIV